MTHRSGVLSAFISVACLLASPATALAQSRHAAEANTRSLHANVPTELTFVNQSGATVKIYWIDYQGQRKYYNTLRGGQSYVQKTFVTHPWVVTDEKDNAWYMYFPDPEARTLVIKAPR